MPKAERKRSETEPTKPAAKRAGAAPAKKTKTTGVTKAAVPAARGGRAPTTAEIEAAARLLAERAFIEAAIARGEAQAAGPSGSLPEGATHELVERAGPGGTPKVRRKRFSAA